MKRGLKFAVLVLTIFGLIFVSLAIASAACPSGMKGYWKLDETSGSVIDTTGNGNDGTNNGATRGVIGKINNAYSFDGTDDYVDIVNDPSLNPASEITIAAWINPNNNNDIGAVVKKSDVGTPERSVNGYTLEGSSHVTGSANTFRFVIYNGTCPANVALGIPAGWCPTGSTDSLTSGTWYHLVGTYDGSSLKLYLNGSSVSTVPVSGNIVAATNNLVLGMDPANPTTADRFFKGTIDEVAIYNRTLTTEEISTLYQNSLNGYNYCETPPTCSDDDRIMKLFSSTNSHGALWNNNNYVYDICCSDIFGVGNPACLLASPHTCTGTNKVLGLFSDSNAHAEVPTETTYTTNVCYGDLECEGDNSAGNLCNDVDKKVVVRLSQDTNSHISNKDDTSYPIKICCKSATLPASLTGAYFTNMIDESISQADLNDRVKLKVTGTGIQTKEINYTIERYTTVWIFFKTWREINSFSTFGFSTWRANETGTYRFKAIASDGSTNEVPSGNLEVSDSEANSPPVANITSPEIGDIYFIQEDMSFVQESYDEDDFINYTWDLGDREIKKGSTRDYVNYNFNYQYNSLGQMTIKLDVADERGLTDNDRTSVLIINSDVGGEDKYVFAHIGEPEWGKNIEGYSVFFNASPSYAINTTNCNGVSCEISCLGGGCPEKTYSGVSVNDPNNKRWNYDNLNFSWSFDDGVKYEKKGVNGAEFTKTFGKSGKHWAKLTVSINPSGSTETEFTTTLKEICQIDLESGKWLWLDSNGDPHDPRFPEGQGYCQDEDGSLEYPNCCPPGYACVDPNTDGDFSDTICQVSTDDYCANIVSCDNYKDETNCSNDICGRGSLQPASTCGGTITGVDDICGAIDNAFTSRADQCKCEWVASEGKCIHKANLWSSIYIGEQVIHSCDTISQHGECIDGLMRVKVNGTIIWDQAYLSTLSAAERAELEELCDLGKLCPDYEGNIVCGGPLVKLTFFSLKNLIIAVLIIVIIYLILLKRKAKKKVKQKAKKK